MPSLTLKNRAWIEQKLGKKDSSNQHIDMKCVASIILGGGEGTRLFPLTLNHAKPAVPFGAKYRLIDVPISNSLHAGCQKAFILTQFLSSSLHHHIFNTYQHHPKGAEVVEVLTAEQKPDQKDWFHGTADAVRQNLKHFLEFAVDYFLILSGDQLYNINFREMLSFAKETNADLVIASLPVKEDVASRLGILKVNSRHMVTDFVEKPQDKELLHQFTCSEEILEKVGITDSKQNHYLGSMGIYLFKREALVQLLTQDEREDFGKHLIPTKVKSGKVAAYVYGGYWEDIGTIDSFYKANMALTGPNPSFYLHDIERPIYSCRYDLPPVKISNTQLKNVIISEGSMIDADEITGSLIGPRTVIHRGSIIRDSYLMGNDYYYASVPDHSQLPIRPHIGEGTIIRQAIIDKNVCIGKGVQLINKENLVNYDGDQIYIRDSIIVVPRGAHIPDGFIL